MSQGQDIISLGIDVTSFDASKKKLLNEYIAIFDKLNKYDGKVYNVMFGSGISDFNKSLVQTNQLLLELNSSIQSVNNSNVKMATTSVSSSESVSKSTKKQKQSILDLAIAKNKEAEISTKLAAANLKEANAKLQNEKAALNLANANLRVASGSERSAAKAALVVAQNRAAAAALTARVAAERQLIAAEYQLSTANEISAVSASKNSNAQKAGAKAILDATLQTKQASAAVQSASAGINSVTSNINLGTDAAKGFGNEFSKAFGQLRVLAYILPGIGLAGIFNLMYEAIVKVTLSLTDTGDKLENLVDIQVAFNDVLKEQVSIQKDLIEQREKLIQLTSQDSSTRQKLASDLLSAVGYDGVTIARQDVATAQSEYIEARSKLPTGIDINTGLKKIGELQKKQKELQDYILQVGVLAASKDDRSLGEKIDAIVDILVPIGGDAAPLAAGKLSSKKVDGKYLFKSQSELDSILKFYQSELSLAKNKVDKELGILEDFFKKEGDLHIKNQELTRVLNDEIKNNFINSEKEKIKSAVQSNKIILDDARSTQKERINAINNIKAQEKKLNEIERIDVTGTTPADVKKYGVSFFNISSTEGERRTARLKEMQENERQNKESQEDITKVNIEFYQRLIESKEKISKSNIEKEAQANERIYKNEQRSLEERLAAYHRYIKLKQQIEQIELEKDIQKGAEQEGGKTALTQFEKSELINSAENKKVNLQADYEKQIFDIVYSSLKKRVKLVEDENQNEYKINKAFYTSELKALNDLYDNKGISYKKYKLKIKELEDKYNFDIPSESVKKDRINLDRIQNEKDYQFKLLEDIEKELQQAEAQNIGPKQNEDEVRNSQKRYDTAIGTKKAILATLLDLEIDYENTLSKLKDDALRAELARIKKLLDEEEKASRRRDDLLKAFMIVEKAIYNAAKDINDAEYRNKQERLSAEKQIINEQYSHKKEAVEKATIDEKNKTALEIQLSSEKIQNEKNLAIEEKRIKREKAQYDKDLAIADIMISTAAAIAANLKVPVLAVAAGIAGAAQLAAVYAVDIPSYEKGTGNFKHKGGYARTGEKNKPEIIKEPYKSPYLVTKDNISYLPAGTEVIPISDNKILSEKKDDDGWAQVIYLAKKLKPKETKNVFRPIIKIDTGFDNFKKSKLGR